MTRVIYHTAPPAARGQRRGDGCTPRAARLWGCAGPAVTGPLVLTLGAFPSVGWLPHAAPFLPSPPLPPPSGSCPPVLTLSLLVVLLLLFFFLSLAVGKNWLTRIIQAAPACWGLCKWIWELLVSHDSNVHYWRWMFLKKRLMMDIRLIVPFIILNII